MMGQRSRSEAQRRAPLTAGLGSGLFSGGEGRRKLPGDDLVCLTKLDEPSHKTE
jgi:hypothetical protein